MPDEILPPAPSWKILYLIVASALALEIAAFVALTRMYR